MFIFGNEWFAINMKKSRKHLCIFYWFIDNYWFSSLIRYMYSQKPWLIFALHSFISYKLFKKIKTWRKDIFVIFIIFIKYNRQNQWQFTEQLPNSPLNQIDTIPLTICTILYSVLFALVMYGNSFWETLCIYRYSSDVLPILASQCVWRNPERYA